MTLKYFVFSTLSVVTLALTPVAGSAMDDHQHGSHGPAPAATPAAASSVPKDAQEVAIAVTSKGFEPSTVTVKSGKPVKLVVTRKTDRTCATEIVMKDFGVNQPLPLEKPVTIVVNPKGPGQYRFSCSMNMVAGTLNVQ